MQNMPTATQSTGFMPEPSRRGLKPGQVHSGSFKKGDDPRRASGMVVIDGITFARKARELGPAVLDWFDVVYRDERHPINARIQAAKEILDRGFGKAMLNANINVSDARSVSSLSLEEMEAILAGEQPQFNLIDHDGAVIDAEFTTVTTTEVES